MAQLTALGVEPGNQDSAAKSFATLKNDLVQEKTGWEKAQADAETLAQAVEELKKIVDKFTNQIPA
jgi:hypothetical protein